MKASDLQKPAAISPLGNPLCDANAKRVNAGVVRYTDTKIELTSGARESDPLRRRTAMDDDEEEESASDEEPSEEEERVAKARSTAKDAARTKLCFCCGNLGGV